MSLPRNLLPRTACMTGLAAMAAIASVAVHAEQSQDLDCVITPSALVEVSAAVPGVLGEVTVDRSARVTKGQLLARLDSGVELAELELAKARTKMDALVRLHETGLDFDRRSWNRLSSLHGDKLVSAEEKERAEREARLTDWRLKDAKDLLRQRELETVRAQQVLLRRQVFSPIDGIVVQRMHHPGEYVEEQPIVRIAQLDPLYVEAIVPMSEFGRIQVGMRARVLPEIDPDHALTADVVVVDGIGDAASGTFGVRLVLPNPDHGIPAGVKCSLQFLGDRLAHRDPGTSARPRPRAEKLTGVLAIDRP